MGLQDYVNKKRSIADKLEKEKEEKVSREQWAKHVFLMRKNEIAEIIRSTFESSGFRLQEDSTDSSLSFLNTSLSETATAVFRLSDSFDVEISINEQNIGKIIVSDPEGNGFIWFDPIGIHFESLGDENSFQLALDKLIENAPFIE